MLQLDRVTLICVDCKNYGSAITAIKKSISKVNFGKVLFLTDIDIQVDGIETVVIQKINSKKEYSKFIIKELYKYFDTDYCLIVQHDSWVLDADAWDDCFYDYDVVGAKWVYVDGRNVSNGGFSLRTKKLQVILAADDLIDVYDPEDTVIGRLYRDYLEKKYEIKFPPEEVCDKFSFELTPPYKSTFGFHSFFHAPYKPMVVISRQAALGDVISTEPVLAYFHKKGYNVVLDTLPQFEEVFYRHYFPVLFPSQVDAKQLEHATKYNLDMSYESKPKENRLKTYYEFCGVTDGEMVSPKLSLGFDAKETQRLFKEKYVVIHLDKMSQPFRNIEGIHWEEISVRLKLKGYNIIQIGGGEHKDILNAIQMNTVNIMLLMYIVAGASLFVGLDSGISHVASGFNIPSIIFFGSVNPEIVHADMTNKICLHNHDGEGVCNKPYCYHESITTVGQDCYLNKDQPPCTLFTTEQLINAINVFI
jgi:ADP-heptose:LPS heptosyltransferase